METTVKIQLWYFPIVLSLLVILEITYNGMHIVHYYALSYLPKSRQHIENCQEVVEFVRYLLGQYLTRKACYLS